MKGEISKERKKQMQLDSSSLSPSLPFSPSLPLSFSFFSLSDICCTIIHIHPLRTRVKQQLCVKVEDWFKLGTYNIIRGGEANKSFPREEASNCNLGCTFFVHT